MPMTHKEFCCWLEGFFMRGGQRPTDDHWHEIGKRLQKTMNPEAVDGPSPTSEGGKDRNPEKDLDEIRKMKNDITPAAILREAMELSEELAGIPPLFRTFEEQGKKSGEQPRMIKFRRFDLNDPLNPQMPFVDQSIKPSINFTC